MKQNLQIIFKVTRVSEEEKTKASDLVTMQ